MNLLRQLQEPFPQHSGVKKNFFNLLGVGTFVTLFLFFFKPFGIENAKDQALFICACFGLVTVLFGVIFDLAHVYVLKIRTDLPSWTLGKWIIQSAVLLVWIASGNFLLILLIDRSMDFNGWNFIQMIFNTTLIGIFPIIFSGLMTQLKANKQNTSKAKGIDVEHPTPSKEAPIEQQLKIDDFTSISYHHILFLEAQQNYVAVHYHEQGENKSELIRSTLTKWEESFDSPFLVRCHRSYIININQVEKVNGNAQGLKVKMKNEYPLEVPVSRSYIPSFSSHFQH